VGSPRVVAIVLNYNRPQDTIECAFSLRDCTYGNLEIIVVDNGSTDDSEMRFKEQLGHIKVLLTGRNLGFAAGNNVGILHALDTAVDYILLINNDTLVEPDFLDKMVEEMEGNRGAAAAGCTICSYPDKDTVWYAGGRIVSWRAGCLTEHVGSQYSSLPNLAVRRVSFITGCLILVRADIFRKLGLLDERFFMYLEDAEFSHRLTAAGYQLLYIPHARIYHRAMLREDNMILYYGIRNRFLFIETTTQGLKRRVVTAYLLVATLVKMLFVWSFRRPDYFGTAKCAIADYYSGVLFQGRGLAFRGPSLANCPVQSTEV
jgi:GT2 family glycosyltransferase